jgi:hypothetical protein
MTFWVGFGAPVLPFTAEGKAERRDSGAWAWKRSRRGWYEESSARLWRGGDGQFSLDARGERIEGSSRAGKDGKKKGEKRNEPVATKNLSLPAFSFKSESMWI